MQVVTFIYNVYKRPESLALTTNSQKFAKLQFFLVSLIQLHDLIFPKAGNLNKQLEISFNRKEIRQSETGNLQ